MENTTWPEGFPDPRLQPTVSVPEAAHWLGIGNGAAYEGVRNGTLPAVRIGLHKLRVPTAALARLLQLDAS